MTKSELIKKLEHIYEESTLGDIPLIIKELKKPMTTKKAMDLTNPSKKSNFRILSVAELNDWEVQVGWIKNVLEESIEENGIVELCTTDNGEEKTTHFTNNLIDACDELEHEILSVKL